MSARLVEGLADAEYHADKSTLSVSGAKKLLSPYCPAIFKHERDNGQAPRREFDIGRAAHAEVLGVGGDVEIVQKTTRDKQQVDADDYATKSAQEHRDAIRAAGKTPLLAHEVSQIKAMAQKLREHELAAALFDPDHGQPEVSGYWTDETTGIHLRCRFDWLPDVQPSGRLIIPDFKTAAAVDRASIRNSSARFGYGMQDDWYSDGAKALGLAEDPAFVFVFQMKEPPFLVNVIQLDEQWKELGSRKNSEARATYAECVETDRWPGFGQEIDVLDPPKWLVYEMDDAA